MAPIPVSFLHSPCREAIHRGWGEGGESTAAKPGEKNCPCEAWTVAALVSPGTQSSTRSTRPPSHREGCQAGKPRPGPPQSSKRCLALSAAAWLLLLTAQTLAQPDLTVVDIQTTPAQPTVGKPCLVTAVIRNQGNAAAGRSLMQLEITRLNGQGRLIELPGLAPGQTTAGSESLTFAILGTFTLCVTVDVFDAVAESSEANNRRCGSVTSEPTPAPDLVVTQVWTVPESPVEGQSYEIKAMIRNTGEVTASRERSGSIDCYFYQKGPGLTAVFEQVGGGLFDDLAPCQSVAVSSGPLTAPSTGSYSLKARADAANEIAESNETNNEPSIATLAVRSTDLANLVVTALTVVPSKQQQPTPPRRQDEGPDGLVSLEAEHNTTRVDKGGHPWLPAAGEARSGGLAVEATPNVGVLINEGLADTSPRLDSLVDFVKSGPHYVWARGFAASAAEESVHFGLDRQARATADRVGGFSWGDWSWSGVTLDEGTPAFLDVPSPGLHTVNVWMREDGFALHKIVLTTSPSQVREGLGPPESSPKVLDLIPCRPSVAVSNSGQGVARPSTIEILLGSSALGTAAVPPSDPGQSAAVEATILVPVSVAVAICAKADANSDVAARNELDNTLCHDFILAAPSPRLALDRLGIALGYSPAQTNFHISSAGTGTLTYSVAVNQPWPSVGPATGVCTITSNRLELSVDISRLLVGVHTGVVAVTSSGGSAQFAVIVPIADDAADRIEDGWEILHFGSAAGCDRTVDPDVDGHNNFQEWIAGSRPLDPSSAFRITDIAIDPMSGKLMLEWPTMPGRLHTVIGARNIHSINTIIAERLPSSSWRIEPALPASRDF